MKHPLKIKLKNSREVYIYTIATDGTNGTPVNGVGMGYSHSHHDHHYDHHDDRHDEGWRMAVELGREENRSILAALNGLAETLKANSEASQTDAIKNEINHIEDQITNLISSGQLSDAKSQSDILERIGQCCCDVKEAIGSVKENVNGVKDTICDLKGEVKDSFYTLNSSTKDGFSNLNSTVKDSFYGLNSSIKDNFYGLNTTTKDGFCGLNTSLLQVAANLTEKMNAYNLQHTHQVDMGFCNTGHAISASTATIVNQAAANTSNILCAIK